MSQVEMRAAGLAVLEAVTTRLKADLPNRTVLSRTPKNPTYPYIAIGVADEVDMWTGNSSGSVVDFDVQCFSVYYGNKEVEELKGEVINSVTRALLDLSASDFLCLETRLEWAGTILDQDQTTWICTVKFSSMVDDLND